MLSIVNSKNVLNGIELLGKPSGIPARPLIETFVGDLALLYAKGPGELKSSCAMFKLLLDEMGFQVDTDGNGSFPQTSTEPQWKALGKRVMMLLGPMQMLHEELSNERGPAKKARIEEIVPEEPSNLAPHPMEGAGVTPAALYKENEETGRFEHFMAGTTIPPAQIQGKDVDLYDLNRKIVVPPNWNEVLLQPSGDGLGFKQSRVTRLTRAQWELANFNVLELIPTGPARDVYKSYVKMVHELADKFPWVVVHDFDAQVRGEIRSGLMPGGFDASTLYARFLLHHGVSHSLPRPSNPPPRALSRTNTYRRDQGRGVPVKTCHFFNKLSGCSRQGCTFVHKCSKCGDSRHGGHACTRNNRPAAT